jgi:hypothetical protein
MSAACARSPHVGKFSTYLNNGYDTIEFNAEALGRFSGAQRVDMTSLTLILTWASSRPCICKLPSRFHDARSPVLNIVDLTEVG